MKHDLKVTLFLLALFFATQVIGLFIFSRSIIINTKFNETTGRTETLLNYTEVITGRPETTGSASFTFILMSILIGTGLVLLIIRFSLFKLWKGWFFFAVAMTLAISFSIFVNNILAFGLGLVLAYFKIFRPNIFTHNLTEVLMYSGIAVMLVPIMGDPSRKIWIIPENVFWMLLLLIAISIYDAIAVWKSKHMVKMAQFQAKNKLFAGLLIPYQKEGKLEKADIKTDIPEGIKETGVKSAILGGGDIAFPMLFSGAVMEQLIKLNSLPRDMAFLKSLIVPVFVTIALFLLLYKGKKNTFYPAMPFLSLGCIIGYIIVLLI